MNRRALIALAAAVLLCAQVQHARAAPQIALPDCEGALQVRPARVTFACGDGNFFARDLRWSSWGARTARATGTAEINDCTPNCAAGKFHAYRVALTASGRQSCPDGRPAYASVMYAWIGKVPGRAQSAADRTVPFSCTARM